MNRQHMQAGFTLLEVIVALTITGFVLGSLFSLLGGSKQLSWRSEASLIEATRLRAATNFALLEDEYFDVEPILEDDSYEIRSIDILEEPDRKTQPSTYTLEEYEILNSDRGIIITGSRWIQLELPR
ncbi:MAG: type II secretion system protein [Proteobacteria bacterium]|nr:type II secretion system protein [Pseudomonadota bacterium]